MSEVVGNTVGPAVRDRFAVIIESLGDWLFLVVVSVSVPVSVLVPVGIGCGC